MELFDCRNLKVGKTYETLNKVVFTVLSLKRETRVNGYQTVCHDYFLVKTKEGTIHKISPRLRLYIQEL